MAQQLLSSNRQIKKRKILRTSLINVEDNDKTLETVDGFSNFMTRVNSINTTVKQPVSKYDYSIKNSIHFIKNDEFVRELRNAILFGNEEITKHISWYVYPHISLNSATIRKRFDQCKLTPDSTYVAHQNYRANFGQDHFVQRREQLDASCFQLSLQRELSEKELVFQERVQWGSIFINAWKTIKKQPSTYFYVCEKDIWFLLKSTKILISSSTIELRRALKSYGIKYKSPLDSQLKEREHLSNISGLEKLRAYETDFEELSKLQRIESIRDGTDKSALVVDELLSINLFCSFYSNRICRRDGTHGLPQIISFNPFDGSLCKKGKLEIVNNKTVLRGFFKVDKVINIKKHHSYSMNSKMSMTNVQPTTIFNAIGA